MTDRSWSAFGTRVLLLSALVLGACDKGDELTPEQLEAKIAERLDEAHKRVLNNKPTDAENIYKWVLEQKPGHAVALRGLGEVKMDAKDFAGALEFLQQSVAADPADSRAQGKLGEALSALERWEEAVPPLGKAFELAPDNSNYGLAYGIALRNSKKLDEAETVLRQVAELDPQIEFVWTELGDTLREKGQLDEALKTYMKAQSTYRGDERAHAGAGLVYEAQGKITLAIDQWSAYIRMDCCSHYSEDVAKPKLEALRKLENTPAPGGEGSPEGGAEGAAPPAEDAAG